MQSTSSNNTARKFSDNELPGFAQNISNQNYVFNQNKTSESFVKFTDSTTSGSEETHSETLSDQNEALDQDKTDNKDSSAMTSESNNSNLNPSQSSVNENFERLNNPYLSMAFNSPSSILKQKKKNLFNLEMSKYMKNYAENLISSYRNSSNAVQCLNTDKFQAANDFFKHSGFPSNNETVDRNKLTHFLSTNFKFQSNFTAEKNSKFFNSDFRKEELSPDEQTQEHFERVQTSPLSLSKRDLETASPSFKSVVVNDQVRGQVTNNSKNLIKIEDDKFSDDENGMLSKVINKSNTNEADSFHGDLASYSFAQTMTSSGEKVSSKFDSKQQIPEGNAKAFPSQTHMPTSSPSSQETTIGFSKPTLNNERNVALNLSEKSVQFIQASEKNTETGQSNLKTEVEKLASTPSAFVTKDNDMPNFKNSKEKVVCPRKNVESKTPQSNSFNHINENDMVMYLNHRYMLSLSNQYNAAARANARHTSLPESSSNIIKPWTLSSAMLMLQQKNLGCRNPPLEDHCMEDVSESCGNKPAQQCPERLVIMPEATEEASSLPRKEERFLQKRENFNLNDEEYANSCLGKPPFRHENYHKQGFQNTGFSVGRSN